MSFKFPNQVNSGTEYRKNPDGTYCNCNSKGPHKADHVLYQVDPSVQAMPITNAPIVPPVMPVAPPVVPTAPATIDAVNS